MTNESVIRTPYTTAPSARVHIVELRRADTGEAVARFATTSLRDIRHLTGQWKIQHGGHRNDSGYLTVVTHTVPIPLCPRKMAEQVRQAVADRLVSSIDNPCGEPVTQDAREQADYYFRRLGGGI